MADIFTVEKRSLLMAGVKTKNTAPERRIRLTLKKLGIKYRSNFKGLQGEPDIVLLKERVVIFIHGCFWHSHKGCHKAKLPSTHRGFWREKITSNIQRDKRTSRVLRKLGWRVITIWECKTKSNKIGYVLMTMLKSKVSKIF